MKFVSLLVVSCLAAHVLGEEAVPAGEVEPEKPVVDTEESILAEVEEMVASEDYGEILRAAVALSQKATKMRKAGTNPELAATILEHAKALITKSEEYAPALPEMEDLEPKEAEDAEPPNFELLVPGFDPSMYEDVNEVAYDDIDFIGQGDDVEWPPRTVVVYFSAENHACNMFNPHYALAASLADEDDLKAVFYKVDVTGTEEEQMAPFVQMFRHTLHLDYQEEADGRKLASWVRSKGGETIHRIKEPSQLQKLKDDSTTLVVVYEDGGNRGKKVTKAVEEVSFVLNNPAAKKGFAMCNGKTRKDVIAKCPLPEGVFPDDLPLVVLYKNYLHDKLTLSYPAGELQNPDSMHLGQWVFDEAKPLVYELDYESGKAIFNSHIREQVLVVVNTDNEEETAEVTAELLNMAKMRKGEQEFVRITQDQKTPMGFFQVSPEDLPRAFFVNMGQTMEMKKQKKYAFPASRTINTANLDAWVAEVKEGRVKPMVKSEPIPTQEEQDELGHVVKLVGETFMDFIMQDDLEILLEVTAPWCQICKTLDPKLEEFAQGIAGQDNIAIARFDAIYNEFLHDNINVDVFPTFLFFGKTLDEKDHPREIPFGQFGYSKDALGIGQYLMTSTENMEARSIVAALVLEEMKEKDAREAEEEAWRQEEERDEL